MLAQIRARPTAALALFLLDTGFLGFACWGGLILLGRDHPISPAALLFPASYLLFLYAMGLYQREALVQMNESLGRVPAAAGAAGLTSWAVNAILPAPFSIPDVHLMFAAAVPCFAAAGLAARLVLHLLRRRGAFRRRLLVIGAGRRAWDLVWLLRHEARTLAFEVVFVHDDHLGEIDPRLLADPTHEIIPGLDGLLLAVRRRNPDQIVVAPDERRGLSMEGLLACRMAGYPVSEYAQFLEREIGRIDLKRLDLNWLLYADGFVMGTLDRFLKRGFDIVVSAALLVAAAPTLVVAALAVKLGDGGPVFYRQDRVSRGGRVIRIVKLRTMSATAERAGAVWTAQGVPRITMTGSLLRQLWLDEVPQLFNILLGDMAFVGPKAERPAFTQQLTARLPLYENRHLVRAGLTGWAQVNYPYGASLNDARSKLSYDLFYVKNFSIMFDLRIILQTMRVVFWPDRAR